MHLKALVATDENLVATSSQRRTSLVIASAGWELLVQQHWT